MPVFYFLPKYVYSKLHVISIQTLPGHNKKKKIYKIRNKTKHDNGLLLINLISTTRRWLLFFSTAYPIGCACAWIHRLWRPRNALKVASDRIILLLLFSRYYIFIRIDYRYCGLACKDDMPGILNDNLLLSVSGHSVFVCVCMRTYNIITYI